MKIGEICLWAVDSDAGDTGPSLLHSGHGQKTVAMWAVILARCITSSYMLPKCTQKLFHL